jgi:hypothetical protein
MSTKDSENTSKFKEQYKVTVEIEDFLLIKDALSRAIDALNSSQNDFKLKNEPSKYNLRLAKKSGKPNVDLPAILLDNSLKTSKVERISVVFNENHFVTKERNSVTGIGTDEHLFSKRPERGFKCLKCCRSCIIY